MVLFMMLFIGIRGVIGTFLLNGCFFSHADFADYADLSCDTLKYATAMKICVICEICVTKKK